MNNNLHSSGKGRMVVNRTKVVFSLLSEHFGVWYYKNESITNSYSASVIQVYVVNMLSVIS